MLPVLLKRLNKIEDTRNPIYGILCFAFQMASRREATREMTRPMFMANLRRLFPDLENLPHHDTLARILEKIDVHVPPDPQILPKTPFFLVITTRPNVLPRST